ncbi:pyrroline-5-carboxylate reductase dimerization domain-containing protein [Pseudooceanicola sp. 200-1SW]|uniref:pyrroline-5-carboxylate reductase dimerization domain-containing protein n=1 Tax=Pseudooceanicola sp. 200-1SW TaxID=3425949 RepID=UPI003D7FB7A8
MDKSAFIGRGDRAAAILGGLIASGWAPSRITVVDPMIEEMIPPGTTLGLPREDAKALPPQTTLGAATMPARGAGPNALRACVTTLHGTPHAAIVSMQENGFGDVIARAMTACRDRAVELGKG